MENPLANELLSGRFMPGDLIKVDTAADGLTFNNH
jgi:ATP-dependent Clp protease ATP-binding subunit ClpB